MEGGRNVDRTVSRFIRYAECASESHNEKAFCEYMEQELAGMGIPFERQELGNEVVTDGWNIWPEFRAGPVKTFSVRIPSGYRLRPAIKWRSVWKAGASGVKAAAYWGLTASWPSRWSWEAVERLMQEGEINRP